MPFHAILGRSCVAFPLRHDDRDGVERIAGGVETHGVDVAGGLEVEEGAGVGRVGAPVGPGGEQQVAAARDRRQLLLAGGGADGVVVRQPGLRVRDCGAGHPEDEGRKEGEDV